jgi:hypothetical protein
LSWFVAAIAVVLGLTFASVTRAAATYTVNTTADNLPSGSECAGAAGDCSLRQALDKAVSGDTVVVPSGSSPYLVVNEKIPVKGGVTIQGGGASSTTISGNGADQIFDLIGGGPVSITGLTLTDAHNDSGTDEAGAINTETTDSDLTLEGVTISNSDSPGGFGGAIEIGSHVTIRNSRFVNDSATSGGGGAIDLYGTSGSITISNNVFDSDSMTTTGTAGALLIENSNSFSITSTTFSHDSTNGTSGGAIVIGTGTGTIYNSTFTANTASSGGAISSGGSTSLVNDTLAANTAAAGANVNVTSGTLTAENTIFAAPLGGGGNCSGTVTSSGHNLEDTTPSTCGLSNGVNGDIVGQNPQLASALANNSSQVPTSGGPPQTLSIPATSPAVAAGDAAGCATVGSVDERGFPRPGTPGTGCDVGAFELLAAVPTTTTVATSSAAPIARTAVTFTATVTPGRSLSSGVPRPGGTVVFHDGTTTLATVGVDANGHATLSTASLRLGTHSISATYNGDAIYLASPSSPLSVRVVPPRPKIRGVSQSHKRWREGKKRATLARAKKTPPLGTRFAFTLNTRARVSPVFKETLPGRRAGKKCVAQTNRNKQKHACTRTVKAGTLSFTNVAAGKRKIAFQGRLKNGKKLRPGHYTMVITAANVSGHTSSRAIGFTIV